MDPLQLLGIQRWMKDKLLFPLDVTFVLLRLHHLDRMLMNVPLMLGNHVSQRADSGGIEQNGVMAREVDEIHGGIIVGAKK